MTSPLAPPALRVLWLCGPPGVGKSVTAWALFHALGDEGVHVAHVDIDQLGMLYPASAADPERHRLKATALAGLLPTYAAAGVQVVVVSGVVDPASPAFADVTLRACTTFCLLTVDEAILRRRILDRGWAEDIADEAVGEARALQRAPYLDAVVDTTDHSVADVVSRVRRLLGPPSAPGGVLPQTAASSAASSVGMTVVSGPRAVGSSTVGFALARARWANDVTTGFLDLQQLAFVRRPGEPGHSSTTLGLAHLATMHRHFADHGAEQVVVSAHLEAPHDHDGVRRTTGGQVCVVRLRADAATLAAHVAERTRGSDARLAGDDLVDASPEQQTRILQRALAEQRALDAAGSEDVVVDASRRAVHEVVDTVERHLRP